MRARLCLYDPFSTKASIKINYQSFRYRLVSVRDRGKIVIWKIEFHEKKTAVTRYTIRNKHFHAPFRLLLIRKWKQQLLLLHLPFHSHYSYCEVRMSVFQWKRWLVCRWKSYFSFVSDERDSMHFLFRKFLNTCLGWFSLADVCPCFRFFTIFHENVHVRKIFVSWNENVTLERTIRKLTH